MHITYLSQIEKVLSKISFSDDKPIVFVHSGLFSFGVLEGGVPGLLDLLWDWVGVNGTILMPAFTFSPAHQWDYRTTKSEMGILTEYFRNQSYTQRTLHPLHSICVAGKLYKEFSSMRCVSSFDENSAFSELYRRGAVNISLGTKFEGGATYLHYFEEKAQVFYRKHIKIDKEVIDKKGNLRSEDFKYFARVEHNGVAVSNDWVRVYADLVRAGLIKVETVGPAPIMWSSVSDVGEFMLEKLTDDPAYCLQQNS